MSPPDAPAPIGGSITATTTSVQFDRAITLLSAATSAWSVQVGFLLVPVTNVAQVGADQVRLTHLDAAMDVRLVSMVEQVVAGDPDGVLAELFSDFPVS